MALAGYWKFNRTRFEACNPPSACQGGSSQECATGYTGRFCSACVAGKYYRDTLSRECLVCPNQAWLYIAGFVLACTVGGFMVYKIFRARPSLAAITIVLDYLQVLSIVGNLDLKWPESFITLYHWSSAAAFNIDIVSPECSFALTYATKWYALQSVPILSLLVLLAAHVGNCIRKFVAGRRGPLTKHWHKLASWWLLLLNLLYLALLKKVKGRADVQLVVLTSVVARRHWRRWHARTLGMKGTWLLTHRCHALAASTTRCDSLPSCLSWCTALAFRANYCIFSSSTEREFA